MLYFPLLHAWLSYIYIYIYITLRLVVYLYCHTVIIKDINTTRSLQPQKVKDEKIILLSVNYQKLYYHLEISDFGLREQFQ